MTVAQLTEEAMGLSLEERLALADALELSLSAAERAAIDEAWLKEVQRRMDDIKAGRAQWVDGEKVIHIEGRR